VTHCRSCHTLACVIVTYNRANSLRRCLVNTLQQDVDLVVVIDNGSNDETPQVLAAFQAQDSRLLVERQTRRRGGSWGFARGMRWVDRLLNQDGWVLLYDDDSWPDSGCIERFHMNVDAYVKQELTAVGAAVVDDDGRPVECNRPVLNLFRRPLGVLSLTARGSRSWRDLYHVPLAILKQPGHRLPVDSLSFVGLFVHLKSLPKGRGRYPRGGLFLYSDDTTYTLELGRKGKRIILDTDLVFRHHTTGGGASAGWLTPAWKHYYVVRNSFLMNRSLSKVLYGPLCVATVLLHASKAVVRGWREGDGTVWRLVCLATWDGLRNHYSRSHSELEAYGNKHKKEPISKYPGIGP